MNKQLTYRIKAIAAVHLVDVVGIAFAAYLLAGFSGFVILMLGVGLAFTICEMINVIARDE